jgi:hypothetical protein
VKESWQDVEGRSGDLEILKKARFERFSTLSA